MASDRVLELRDFPGIGNAADVQPRSGTDERPFYEGLAARRLRLQVCDHCQRPRFPVAPACPFCRRSGHSWSDVSPRGTVFSWARYHKGYLPEFAPLVPYVVLAVELADGPIVFGRLADDGVEPDIGMPVRAIVERWADEGHVLAFSVDQESG